MSKNKRTLLSSAVIAALLALGGYYYLTREVPNPAADSVSAAARSGDYASVSNALAAGKLKPEDVRLAVRQEFQKQTLERVNAYFDTTDPKARRDILDKAIDDLERFRAEARKRAAATQPTSKPASRPATTQPAVPTINPQLAAAAWALSQPAATRARLAEFRVALDKRRAERGMPGLFDNNGSLPLGQPTHR